MSQIIALVFLNKKNKLKFSYSKDEKAQNTIII